MKISAIITINKVCPSCECDPCDCDWGNVKGVHNGGAGMCRTVATLK